LQTLFLILSRQLACVNFTGDEVIQRRQQLLQAYQYVYEPYDKDETKVQYLLMMASPGSGKTRMINAIPQSIHVIQEEIDRIVEKMQKIQLKLEKAKAKETSERDEELISSISNKISETKVRIENLKQIKKYVETNVVFLPITFNSETAFSNSETDSDWVIASRMLFKYYGANMVFQEFCETIKHDLGQISPKQALEAIRYDQMFDGDDDKSKRKSDQCRVFLMVDEMGLIRNHDLQDKVFQNLRESFIGEITRSLSFLISLFCSSSLVQEYSDINFSFRNEHTTTSFLNRQHQSLRCAHHFHSNWSSHSKC